MVEYVVCGDFRLSTEKRVFAAPEGFPKTLGCMFRAISGPGVGSRPMTFFFVEFGGCSSLLAEGRGEPYGLMTLSNGLLCYILSGGVGAS